MYQVYYVYYIGSVALKCKKKFTFWSVKIFLLKIALFIEKIDQNILHFYILKCKIWNVRVKQHNPTSLWQGPRKCREEVWLCAFLRLVILYPDISNFTLWNVKNLKCNFFLIHSSNELGNFKQKKFCTSKCTFFSILQQM